MRQQQPAERGWPELSSLNCWNPTCKASREEITSHQLLGWRAAAPEAWGPPRLPRRGAAATRAGPPNGGAFQVSEAASETESREQQRYRAYARQHRRVHSSIVNLLQPHARRTRAVRDEVTCGPIHACSFGDVGDKNWSRAGLPSAPTEPGESGTEATEYRPPSSTSAAQWSTAMPVSSLWRNCMASKSVARRIPLLWTRSWCGQTRPGRKPRHCARSFL